MTFEVRLPSTRPDVSLDEQQEAACLRAERGMKLSQNQLGVLRAAEAFANTTDAARASAALDAARNRGKR